MITFIFFGGTAERVLREYNAFELGLRDVPADATVELRQRYFHVWFVPFFPLGKIWTMRANGAVYPLTDHEKNVAERNAEIPPTPFYTWLGLVIVPLIVALILIIRKENS